MKVYIVMHQWVVEGERDYDVIGVFDTLGKAKKALADAFDYRKNNPCVGRKWPYSTINEEGDEAEIGDEGIHNNFHIRTEDVR